MVITNHSLFGLKLFAVLGCGLVAGVFFASMDMVESRSDGSIFGGNSIVRDRARQIIGHSERVRA